MQKAVDNLNLAVETGECFGLLGVNGAGKTTTLKMLIGDELISSGDAFVHGKSLKRQMKMARQNIGYCPQSDALLEDLTGRETLTLFCLIRGIPKKEITGLSEKLARQLLFIEHLDKKVNECSGGTKRKLSTAVAFIGDPPVMYLDEPTAGMDFVAKRHLWNVIVEARDSGKTIILTSHSMEECEALCTRLAIMVNGKFQCLGSPQHLKSKFADGYELTIKMSLLTSHKSEKQIKKVKKFVESHFKGAQLLEDFNGLLRYTLPRSKMTWSEMFGILETNKNRLKIKDYSLTQRSLEHVFLHFTIARDF